MRRCLLILGLVVICASWGSTKSGRRGGDEPALPQAGLRHESATTDYFDVLGGRAAIRESSRPPLAPRCRAGAGRKGCAVN